MNRFSFDASRKLWWLWIPVFFVAAEFLFERIAPQDVVRALVSENGPVEILEFAIAAMGCVFALCAFSKIDFKENPLPKILAGIAAMGCFYIAGEEISWGQWFLGWTTPEGWQAVNDQGETNLHNTSSWLDQKPRILLEIGMVTGGLILPSIMRARPAIVPAWLRSVTPPPRLGIVAGLYVLVRLADAIGTAAGHNPYERSSEIMETLLFYFVLLYVFYLKARFTGPGLRKDASLG